MKNRWFSLFMAAALLGAFLTGCGRAAKSDQFTGYAAAEEAYADGTVWTEDSYWGEAEEAPAAIEVPRPAQLSAETVPDSTEISNPAKLIYTADLDMETLEFDEAAAAIEALTAACGGYFESSSLSDQGSHRWAQYTIRVPAAQYRAFLDKAGQTCHVLSLNEYTEDVSESYYDTAGRLETQRTKLTRLQQLLLQAQDMEDIITIEDAISETEELIDRLSGTLRHYDALVSYSTVTIYLQEVKVYEPEPDPSYGTRLSMAFADGWDGFVTGLGNLLIALAYSWLWLLLFAGIIVLILWLTRHRRAARKEKRAARKAEAADRDNRTVRYSCPTEESKPEEGE